MRDMKISNKNLIGLKVETQSGQELGRLEDFNLETESQSVLEYIVKPSNIVKDLIIKDLIIPRGQVIDITSEKIVVDDNFVKDKNSEKEKSNSPAGEKQEVPSGVVMKK